MKKLLIVSSSAAFLEKNSALLRRSDFLINTTTTGLQALQRLRQEKTDLLIADIHLEDMDGEKLCETLKHEGLATGLSLILVCKDTREDFERLKGCGANLLLAKPIKPLQLIETVGKYLTLVLTRSRRINLRVKVISKKDSVEIFCTSHNISVTGMLIETEYRLEVGTMIQCMFTLPGSIQVTTEAEIVRVARTIEGVYQYGVFFTEVSGNFRHEIEIYVAKVIRGEIRTN